MTPDGRDYAASKYLKWHRRLLVTLEGALFACYSSRFGVGISIRAFTAFVVPQILLLLGAMWVTALVAI